MAVKIIDGDLFSTSARYICHQVNCQGRMGNGVAKQVRELFPDVYKHYKLLCDADKGNRFRLGIQESVLLGRVQFVPEVDCPASEDINKRLCNMFAQDFYGYDGKMYTDYNAFNRCLAEIRRRVPAGETIAMPYKIGCGLGGGDWNTIYKAIEQELSEDHIVELWRL